MYIKESTLYDLDLRTINIVCGYQGVGKTLFLTAIGYLFAYDNFKSKKHNYSVHFLKSNNYKLDNENIVISNYNLEFKKRGRKELKFNREKNIKNIFEFKKQIASSTLILADEAQDIFNCREWQQTEREASEFCEFGRHFDLNIVFSAQDFESIDKTFRGYSKVYYIDSTKIYDVYGNVAKKNQYFKNIDIAFIEIYYYAFERYEQYKKFRENQSIFDLLTRKKLVINANLFDMYNHKYLNEKFLKKKRV